MYYKYQAKISYLIYFYLLKQGINIVITIIKYTILPIIMINSNANLFDKAGLILL